jgi:branched-chain amino acid transport system permease protein
MDYLLHVIVSIGIYGVLAVSLDLLTGRTGLLSIAHAAFYGIGAYASALLTMKCGWPFTLAAPAAMTVSAAVSLMVSLPSLRVHGEYFVIATFAFQVVLFNVLNNWLRVTGGPLGIPGIAHPVVIGWEVDSNAEFAVLGTVFAFIAWMVVSLIVTSPFGRVLHAIREDEAFAKACGKATLLYKVTAFALSSALAAMAGALYAHYITYIDPTSFMVMESILVLSMVIIGGAGSLWGPLVGAIVLVTLPEALRFVGLPAAAAANLRQIIYGVLLVVMMMARPQGLVGRYAFGRSM